MLEDTHALFDSLWDLDEINLLQTLILGRRVATFVWPVTGGEHFYVQINGKLLAAGALSEVLHPLLGHLNILEHYLEPLGKLKPALFFQLLDNLLLRIFQNPARIKQPLSECSLIEIFKDVFVLEVPENLDDFINFFGNFYLGVVFEILFEILVQI